MNQQYPLWPISPCAVTGGAVPSAVWRTRARSKATSIHTAEESERTPIGVMPPCREVQATVTERAETFKKRQKERHSTIKISTLKAILAGLALLTSVPVARSQTFSFTESTIDSNPVVMGSGVSFEKTIDYFTSTSYPSYFFGSSAGAFIYDTRKGVKITIDPRGYHYERAKPFLYPGDIYPGIIASVDNSLVWYQNPANWNGGDAAQPWQKYVINPNSGCHDLYVVDLDGDGKQDVACSGTAIYNDSSFVLFQNTYNSWTPPHVNVAPAGDGIALVAINGVNGGARTNIVGCSNNNLYWYQNPGGMAARMATWPSHYIGPCNAGVSIASVSVGNRDIVIVASNESEPSAWSPGLVYFDPGSSPYGAWTQHSIDSSYRDVHQITAGSIGDVTYITVGEQEQASNACNRAGYNSHPSINGCRVAIFPWTGNGFGVPTIVSNLGTHNQQVLEINNVAWMVGANHDAFGAVDPAFHLWQFQSGGVQTGEGLSSGTYMITLGTRAVDGGFGYWGITPAVQFYQVISGNTMQYWIWNGSTLQNAGFGRYMTDAGNGTVSEAISGDPWSLAARSGGYTVQNKRSGNYLSNKDGKLAMSNTATVWQISVPQHSTIGW